MIGAGMILHGMHLVHCLTPLHCLWAGPGTGIAPMRALLQERSCQRGSGKGGDSGNDATTNILYFGCQNSQIDYIYR